MKITRVKSSILAVALIYVVTFLNGCETPYEATAGYQWGAVHANQAIFDDVQSFIRSEQIPQKDIQITQYYEDYKTGRIAAVITTENHYSWWNRKDYVIYYDKNGVRTKVKTVRYNHTNM
jgi:hypothetical protein